MLKTKSQKLIVITILLIICCVLAYVYTKNTPPPNLPPNQREEKGGGLEFTYTDQKQISVYDFMTQLQNEGKITFKDKEYAGLGKFITEINGVVGNGSKNWIYYVNGEKAELGISSYKIKNGDVIFWHYE